MIFGNKSDFAIEAMIEPYLAPPSEPWGRLCIWVSGTQIGDFDDPHCGLYNCYISFQEISKRLDALWTKELEGLSDIEIWNFLDGTLYGYHGNIEIDDLRTLEETIRDAEKYSKFDFLTNWGEMFDRGGKSFILKPSSGHIKILNYDYKQEIVRAYRCTELSFYRASREFSNWYSEQVRRLKA